ncbi:Glycerol kinase [hydrothermal vent metagenome]|uniref:Glycerol kinase n=1 Tax=hydrothermal vent metagenome TaxID=652676 RepID=A0A3B1B567_9ZZZZ
MTSILVIDQGTHASKAMLFSASGELIDQAAEPVHLNRIDHEHIEQNPQQILHSIKHAVTTLLARNSTPISQAALTTQRSTVLAWRRSNGKPLSQALSWQDSRSSNELKQFAPKKELIQRITGLPLSPHYGAGKLRWLLQHDMHVQHALKSDDLYIGPLVSYLLYHLLQDSAHLVDHSNAHRTLLMDIEKLNWSQQLLKLFAVPDCCLPKIKPVKDNWGTLQGSGIPLQVVCGDQNAALYSRGPIHDGVATINIGTGAFILMPQQAFHHHSTALLQGIAVSDATNCQYLVEGTVNGAGAALSWAQHKWPVDNLFAKLDKWLSTIHSPPLFINTVGGIGSPWWQTGLAPRFIGPQDIPVENRYAAIIESIAFLLQHNIERLQQLQKLESIQVSGGLSRLNGLCQKLADLSGLDIVRFKEIEATARGAAWLALDQPQDWAAVQPERKFHPGKQVNLKQRYELFTKELNLSL